MENSLCYIVPVLKHFSNSKESCSDGRSDQHDFQLKLNVQSFDKLAGYAV